MKSMNTELQYPYFLYMKNKFGAIVDEKIIKINALILFSAAHQASHEYGPKL